METGAKPGARFLGMPALDWAWLSALALWRLFIAGRLGLGVDEAHYVLYGLHLDWSYLDHPPLIGWIQYAVLAVFGKHVWAARVPAILSGLLSSLLAFRLCERITGNERTARWAVVALNASFVVAALWLMFLPDTILLILVFWLFDIAMRLTERERFRDWLELGLCLGLCGLAKYTAILPLLSLAGFVASEKLWRRVKPGGVIAAALIAGGLVSPVFLWNAAHGWISFHYQQGHILERGHAKLIRLPAFFLIQMGVFSPFTVVPALVGFWRERKDLDRPLRLALWLTLPVLLFFAYVSLREQVLLHWTLIAWGLLIPVGVALLLKRGPAVAGRRSIAASAVITGLLMLELSAQLLRFPPYFSPYADLTGWPQLHAELPALLKAEKPGTYGIAVPNWSLGSRAHYYLDDLAPVFVMDDHDAQFAIWEKDQPKPPDLLVLDWRGFELHADKKARCARVQPVRDEVFSVRGSPVAAVSLFWCRDYRWVEPR